MLTQSFIVISNLEITATWSDFDKDQINKAVSGGIDVGWGLFSLSASYSSNSSNEKVKFDEATAKLTVPGVQIVGWVCNIVPLSPPQ